MPTQLSLLESAALIYLIIPVCVFLFGWLQWWVAFPLAGLLATAAAPIVWLHEKSARSKSLSWPALVAVVAVAVGWTALGGAGHFFFANFDWYVRDAVLRDLVASGWPVAYQGPGDGLPESFLLRAPIAYYLPAALIGKLVGLARVDFLLFLWTALGTGLFLGLAVQQFSTLKAVACVLIVLVFFSGMDLLGTVLKGGWILASNLRITDHLEWWTDRFQYSSHTTQLFWVPNHALPGWIAVALLVRAVDRPAVMRAIPLIVAAVPLWSPLTAIGLAPLAAWVYLSDRWRTPRLDRWDVAILTGALSTAMAIAAYLLMRADDIGSGTTQGRAEPWWFYVPHYLQFVLLEGGILWFLLLFVRRDGLLVISGILLLVLPAVWFGPSNDLAMRGSIPALAVLALYAAYALARPETVADRRVYWAIVVVLVLGLPTPVTEMTRAVREPVWQPDLTRNLIDVNRGSYPGHYVARVEGSIFERIGRSPAELLVPAPVAEKTGSLEEQ